MKKFLTKAAAFAAIAVMSLSMIACGKKYSSVADYVNSTEVKEQITSIEDTLSGTGMSIEIKADGDKMIFSYKYDDIEKMDGMAEQLEAGIEAQSSTFQDTANEMKKLVKADDPTLVIEYVDKNGELIYSEEFEAE